MFMKHYAPNRCLYIKVAKLGTGVGSAEMSHLQNCSLKIYLKRALGGGEVGWGVGVRMDVNEELVFVKMQKIYLKNTFFFAGGGQVCRDGGSGVIVNREVKFLRKLKKKLGGGGGGGLVRGLGGGGVQVLGRGQGGCQ